VKENVLPFPNSLSTQIRPPIMPTRLEAMVRPKPVPPYPLTRFTAGEQTIRPLECGDLSPLSFLGGTIARELRLFHEKRR
jgi:hypothetical protein